MVRDSWEPYPILTVGAISAKRQSALASCICRGVRLAALLKGGCVRVYPVRSREYAERDGQIETRTVAAAEECGEVGGREMDNTAG